MKIRNTFASLLFLSISLCLASCDIDNGDSVNSDSNNAEKLFVLQVDSGIRFSNNLSPTADLNILTYLYYYDGGGVAAGDLNNDGLIDLYFTGNQVADHLYLNQGELNFQEITEEAGIDNASGWTTGVTFVDINNDGLLDIYVCKIGKYKNIEGTNLLYVNQGVNENGVPGFTEEASTYGLDLQTFSTQAAFFDYDLDQDLDMFLLNHSVNPNRTYGKGRLRLEADSLAGDRLMRNDGGKFTDVSAEAGLFQGKIDNYGALKSLIIGELSVILGTGLGISVASLSEFWISNSDFLSIMNLYFLPAFFSNIVNGLILLPIMMVIYAEIVPTPPHE